MVEAPALHSVQIYQDGKAVRGEKALSHKLWLPATKVRKLGLGPEEDPPPGTGVLRGHQWQAREIAEACYVAGFKDAIDLLVIVCVALSESQGYDHAIHVNLNGTKDRGVFQLSSIHAAYTDEIAYDLEASARAAFSLYQAKKNAGAQNPFGDWVGHTAGVYLHDSYLGRADRGAGNFLAVRLLARPVPDKLDGTPYVHKLATPMLSMQHQTVAAIIGIEQAKKKLGFVAASKATVQEVQVVLSKGKTAAKSLLPLT